MPAVQASVFTEITRREDQGVGSHFRGHALLIEGPKLAFIVHFDEFLAAGGREGDIQLHFRTADHLGDAMKKSCNTIFNVNKYKALPEKTDKAKCVFGKGVGEGAEGGPTSAALFVGVEIGDPSSLVT
ncbi:hypothetical protein U0070_014618 [Myodes glareolus]|uniref:Uncharacterized protein n=1 Tax=Myodes glareolus TaxID=447135 RepID=A0AAW0H7D1_MYOGA